MSSESTAVTIDGSLTFEQLVQLQDLAQRFPAFTLEYNRYDDCKWAAAWRLVLNSPKWGPPWKIETFGNSPGEAVELAALLVRER